MEKQRFTPEELFALQAVYRGCNTNKKLEGSIYVQNFGTENEREISYYDALGIVNEMIQTELNILEKERDANERNNVS